MIRIEPFSPHHMVLLTVQDEQRLELSAVQLHALADQQAFTGFAGDTPVIVAGFHQMWPGRALAWAVLSRAAGPHMTQLTRILKRAIRNSGYRRVEATALTTFDEAHRWLLMLGFRLEAARMRHYYGNHDHALYAWVASDVG